MNPFKAEYRLIALIFDRPKPVFIGLWALRFFVIIGGIFNLVNNRS